MAWFPEPRWTIAEKLFPPVCATIAKLFVPTWVTEETLALGGNVFGVAAANAFTLIGAAIFAAEPGSVGHLRLPAVCRAPPICGTKASPATLGVFAAARTAARTTMCVRILPTIGMLISSLVSLMSRDARFFGLRFRPGVKVAVAVLQMAFDAAAQTSARIVIFTAGRVPRKETSLTRDVPAAADLFVKREESRGLACALGWRYLGFLCSHIYSAFCDWPRNGSKAFV